MGGGTGGGTGGGGGSGGSGGCVEPLGTADVRFVATGDTGKGNANQKMVGDAIGAWCAVHGCDHVFLLGDNFYPSGVTSTTDPQWVTAFEQPYSAVGQPFYAVLGNHDYGGGGTGNEFSKGQYEIDKTEFDGGVAVSKWRMPDNHYQFKRGNTEFFVADTNLSMYSLDSAVESSFSTWLPASTAKWKIALGHHPYKSNGPHGNAGSYDQLPFVPIANGSGVKDFLEQQVCGKTDFYLCGHDHIRQWLQTTCSGTELIISGGGADVTSIDDPNRNASYWQEASLGFLYVVIQGGTFYGEMVKPDGGSDFKRCVYK